MKNRQMNEQDWQVVHVLAAELVVLYQADANLLHKAVHYISTERPADYNSLLNWLGAQIEYAYMFPRSLQSLPHVMALRALVDHIAERHTQKPDEIAVMIAWVTRLMSYYKQNFYEAEGLADRRNPVLHVPAPPRMQLASRPARRKSAIKPADKAGKTDAPSRAAQDFMEYLKKRKE